MKLRSSYQISTILLALVALVGCQRIEPPAAGSVFTPVPSISTTLPKSVEPTPSPGHLLAEPSTMEAGAPPSPPWWDDAIFYEVFVRSFQDSDGDGVGDINGLIDRLDYLNDGNPETDEDLGITGIWLMPITESPSYHGYDVVDYYQVDHEYGSAADFKRLIEEAHARGIRVIIDLVMNHTGVDHPWFQAALQGDPTFRDYYLWAEEKPGYKGPWDQEVWHKTDGGYYYGVFWSGMPDLNLANPAVTEELFSITRFWLEDMGVDGFRLDAIMHFMEDGPSQVNLPATHTWLQAFHDYYKAINPEAFTIGEAWTTTPQVLDYTGDEVDIAFEFDLAQAFLATARGPLATPLINQMQVVMKSYPAGQYGVFLANHDQNRVMSALRGDVESAKLAATLLLTSPGVPFLYYGEEIGMTGEKPDEDIRRPMQWTSADSRVSFTQGTPWRAVPGDYTERSVAVEAADPDSLYNRYRDLLHLRENYSALRTGEWQLVDAGSMQIYAFLRHDAGGTFLVLVNVHPKAQTASQYALSLADGPLEGPVRVVTHLGPGGAVPPVVSVGGGFRGWQPFSEIPARTAVVLQLVPEN